jgi:hypothetical protein
MKLKTSSLFFLIISFTFFISGCKKDKEALPKVNPGDLISYELISTLSTSQIDSIRTQTLTSFLSDASLKADQYVNRIARPTFAVKLYRVKYHSIIPESGNKPTIATGLIAIPETSSNQLPMISYQHGTVFYKSMVPSVYAFSDETKFMVQQFASQGYILIAADYFGLGNTSTEANSYFVRYSTEQACLDLYKAAQKVLEAQQIRMSKFFISGWSQGAYNTMLFLRRLEKENIPVRAAFTAAAPVDPQLFVTRGLFNPRPFDAVYQMPALCNVMFGIEKYNKLDGITKKYIKPKYYSKAKDFYEFKLDYLQFMDSVPSQLDSVFTADFYQDARSVNTPFWQILASSEAYRWLSPTPLRAYYGLRDEAVPEYVATLAVDYMKILGKTNGQSFNAGANADHRNTFIESIVDAKSWIDSY